MSSETSDAFVAVYTLSVVGATKTDATGTTTRLAIEVDVEHARGGVIIALTG